MVEISISSPQAVIGISLLSRPLISLTAMIRKCEGSIRRRTLRIKWWIRKNENGKAKCRNWKQTSNNTAMIGARKKKISKHGRSDGRRETMVKRHRDKVQVKWKWTQIKKKMTKKDEDKVEDEKSAREEGWKTIRGKTGRARPHDGSTSSPNW